MSSPGEHLDSILQCLGALSPKERESILAADPALLTARFVPSPGPQTDAWLSQADVLLYGGQAGGGKSALLLGLALTAHERSLIMRRHYGELSAITDEAVKFYGTREGFNGAPPPSLRTKDGRLIEFGAAQYAGDELKWQGQPHDLLAIDEAACFLESQVRNLIGWVRTTTKGQRTRIVLATNPPTTAEGDWIVKMFAPWLDLRHPRPAKAGELRWYASNAEGQDVEVDGPQSVEIDGRTVRPMSRTFIPARLADNPFLASTDYAAKLDSLPEPLRSAVRDGNFMVSRQDDIWQAIPTDWIRQAQARWTKDPPENVPMCSMGVDIAQGGSDNTVLAFRYDGWYAPLLVVPGVKTPTGDEVAGLIVANRRHGATVVLDMGGGYGGAPMLRLKDNGIEAAVYKGAEKAMGRTMDGKLTFTNKRTEAYWRFREALDPSQPGGSPIALPPDPELVSDLTSPRYEVGPNGIKLEPKEHVKERIGRSPDKGDAVVMAWAFGLKNKNVQGGFQGAANRPFLRVVHGHEAQRRLAR